MAGFPLAPVTPASPRMPSTPHPNGASRAWAARNSLDTYYVALSLRMDSASQFWTKNQYSTQALTLASNAALLRWPSWTFSTPSGMRGGMGTMADRTPTRNCSVPTLADNASVPWRHTAQTAYPRRKATMCCSWIDRRSRGSSGHRSAAVAMTTIGSWLGPWKVLPGARAPHTRIWKAFRRGRRPIRRAYTSKMFCVARTRCSWIMAGLSRRS
mmetsp:Transcript_27095/g.44030  ORF Transcript_27095/g.44030 Transcript_27095/m.44030 type:complete len:213 (-) Transcript_27095:1120-1758(-)